jgi:hypothetical protein
MATLEEIKISAKNNMSICKMCRTCNGETCRGGRRVPVAREVDHRLSAMSPCLSM